MVAAYLSTEGTDTLHGVIEKSGHSMTRLARAIDPDAERRIRTLYQKLRRALPPEHHSNLLKYAEAEGAGGQARMQAGFLIGIAVAQHTFAPLVKAIKNIPTGTGPRRGGRR
jgi:hypothetical protein